MFRDSTTAKGKENIGSVPSVLVGNSYLHWSQYSVSVSFLFVCRWMSTAVKSFSSSMADHFLKTVRNAGCSDGDGTRVLSHFWRMPAAIDLTQTVMVLLILSSCALIVRRNRYTLIRHFIKIMIIQCLASVCSQTVVVAHLSINSSRCWRVVDSVTWQQ